MLVRQAEGTSAFKRHAQYYFSVGISIAQAQLVYGNNIPCIRPLSRMCETERVGVASDL